MSNTLRELLVEISYKDRAIPELDKVDKKVDDVKNKFRKTNEEIARLGKDLTKAGKAMTSAGSWMTKRVTLPIAAAAGASIKTFIDLEEAFAGVEKTVDGTESELKNIRKELDHMASNTIPVARKELYGIAENAGQLGIKTKDITKFSSTIAKLGATTNLTYDSASSEIARFANITGMSMDNIERLGSTIVELGNNTSTTEAEIMSMAMRLGAAGKQVGMTQADIMGLSAGLSSLGLEAEAGGTAVSKLLFDMQVATMTGGKKLGQYAKVAKMSSKEFKKAFEKNAANALVMFTEGLGELQSNGENVIGILNDMSLSEVRLRDAILRTAGSNKLLNETINMGNIAWEQNIALGEEFAKKAGTSASNIQLMKSKVEEVGNAFGEHLIPHVNTGLDLVTRMVNKFGELTPDTQTNIFNGLLGLAVAGPALKGLGKLATKLGNLNTAVSTAGGWGPYLAGAGASIKAFATGPVMIAVGKLALLAGAIYLVYKNWDKIKEIGQNLKNNTINFFTGKTPPKTTEELLEEYKHRGPSVNSNYLNKKYGLTKVDNRPVYGGYRIPIDNNYTGTNYWKGGLTRLAEHGPELVVGKQIRNLPKGSKVINNRETEDLFRNDSKSIASQDATFAPVFNINLTNGNREELERTKETLKKEFDGLMEDFFYRFRKKIAEAN